MELITEEEREFFTTLLTVEDYKKVALNSGFSLSTVANIIRRKTRVHKGNRIVLDELRAEAEKKIPDLLKLISRQAPLLLNYK
jgi:phosphoenolpyruvate synthase/pyruvate phosphate dikinase